jgi:hypothetical protein
MRTIKKVKFLHFSTLYDPHWRRKTATSIQIRFKRLAVVSQRPVTANETIQPSLVALYQQVGWLQKIHIWDSAAEALDMRVQAMCLGQDLCRLRTWHLNARSIFLQLTMTRASISSTIKQVVTRVVQGPLTTSIPHIP